MKKGRALAVSVCVACACGLWHCYSINLKTPNQTLSPLYKSFPLLLLFHFLSFLNTVKFLILLPSTLHLTEEEEEERRVTEGGRSEKMSSSSSSSNSPCAACKFLRRKCTQECVFAPYFPPDNPQRFAYVHKVFGASNVAKLLNELNAAQRDDAVKSLAYEAEARLRDPVYGCVGLISVLQHKLRQIQVELNTAKKELATYIGPQALQGLPAPILQQQHTSHPFSSSLYPYSGNITAATAQMVIRDPQPPPPQQHQILEAQQLAAAVAAREQQEMFRSYEQQHQQQEFLRFSGGFDVGSGGSPGGFSQVSPTPAVDQLSPSLALGSFDNTFTLQQQPQQGEPHSHPHHLSLQAQLLLPPQQKQVQPQTQQSQLTHHHHHQQQPESEECRSVGPSC
ncbi:LOB domain-containing protein 36 [Lotus japonicus]|uniref:LOB domain-containing protein 36 n=1 Tax=Lotus japonicus TaxID=34305 RepID=UPI0025857804|nr:LOB domain-containing protein 36 [Lotus japonicus]